MYVTAISALRSDDAAGAMGGEEVGQHVVRLLEDAVAQEACGLMQRALRCVPLSVAPLTPPLGGRCHRIVTDRDIPPVR